MLVLTLLGLFTGMFYVPLQVFLQSRPPDGLKGRMIATQNLLNWVGICVSAAIYGLADNVLQSVGWPPAATFALCAVFMLPVALMHRPQVSEALATDNSPS